jgi:lipopolysaccharide transport system ATP-binding protein
VAIYRPDGTCVMQVIASLSGQRFAQLEGKGGIRVDFAPLLLGPGDYLVSVALFRELNLASAVEPSSYDLHDRCHALKVLPPSGIHVQIGVVNQPAHWELLS